MTATLMHTRQYDTAADSLLTGDERAQLQFSMLPILNLTLLSRGLPEPGRRVGGEQDWASAEAFG